MTSVIPTTVCAREQFVWSASTQLTSLGIRKMRPVRLRRATLIMRIRLVRLIAAVKCVWRVNCVACTSLTFLATLVSARLSVAICLFHEQLVLESLASLSQLQMSGTHCRFTFDPHTLVGQFRAGSRLIFLDGLSLTFSLSTIKEIELNCFHAYCYFWWCKLITSICCCRDCFCCCGLWEVSFWRDHSHDMDVHFYCVMSMK